MLRRSLSLFLTLLKPGVGLYLLPVHDQEPIAQRPLRTYHRQPVGEACSSSTPIDHMMEILTRLEQGQHSLTSQMGRLKLGQATIQTHLTSLDTRLTIVKSGMRYALYPIYHDYFHQGLVAQDATHPSWYTPQVHDPTNHGGDGTSDHAAFGDVVTTGGGFTANMYDDDE